MPRLLAGRASGFYQRSFQMKENCIAQQLYESCIDACNFCADACDHCAASCLQEDDVKMMSRCIALDTDCAQVCRLAASYMARGSEFASALCQTCAEICDACADECEKYQMEHCKACAQAHLPGRDKGRMRKVEIPKQRAETTMTIKHIFLALASAALLFGCGGSEETAAPLPDTLTPIAFTQLGNEPSSLRTEQTFVFTDASSWASFWSSNIRTNKPVPAVDFASNMVIGTIVRVPMTCLLITIVGVSRSAMKIVGEYSQTGTGCQPMIDYVTAFAAVPRSAGSVEFLAKAQ
jgi:hypothetical protein